jgi:hypothetical protein
MSNQKLDLGFKSDAFCFFIARFGFFLKILIGHVQSIMVLQNLAITYFAAKRNTQIFTQSNKTVQKFGYVPGDWQTENEPCGIGQPHVTQLLSERNSQPLTPLFIRYQHHRQPHQSVSNII